jgi:hypothetical protein
MTTIAKLSLFNSITLSLTNHQSIMYVLLPDGSLTDGNGSDYDND